MKDEKLKKTIEKLRKIRSKQDIKAPSSEILKSEISDGVPLTLRNYQIQGILHLLAMPI